MAYDEKYEGYGVLNQPWDSTGWTLYDNSVRCHGDVMGNGKNEMLQIRDIMMKILMSLYVVRGLFLIL